MVDATNQSFTDSGGLAGQYHIWGAGLPGNGAGLVVHFHGDAAYEHLNPTDEYCFAGNRGMRAVAKAKGYVLVSALAPDTTGTVTWWEAGARNATYMAQLLDFLVTTYHLNRSKIWLSGYSGGAQFISYHFVPPYGAAKITGGGAVILGGGVGGAPNPTGWTTAFKNAFPMNWITGGQDDGTYSPDGYDALTDANAGRSYYAGQGFTTTLTVPPGWDHEIDGAFGPVLDDFLPALPGYTPPSRTPGSTRPTLVTSYLVTATGTATTTSPSFTPAAGEVIVVKAWNDDLDSPNFGSLVGGGLTFATKQQIQATSHAEAWVFAAEVGATSPGSMTVSMSWQGTTGQHGIIVERWANAMVKGIPAQSSPVLGSGAPSATLTTTTTASVITWLNVDWNVVAGTATYRSSAVQTQASSTANVRAYAAYQNPAAIAAQTVGLTAPTGQAWSLGAIELLPAPDVATTPVVRDASTPAAVTSDTAVSSLTTAAFTPPAGSVLLMMALFDTATSGRTGAPSTVTGSTSAWTTVGDFNNGTGTLGGLVHISWARVSSSVSTTARVTFPASNDCALKVWVLTGTPSAGSPIGVFGSATLNANPQTVSYAASGAGSQGFIGLEDFSQAGVKTISNTTTEATLSSNSNGIIARDSATAGSAGQTRAFTIAGTPGGAEVAWVEVIGAGTTPGGGGGGGGGGGNTTGGNGGPLTDRTNVSYTNSDGTVSAGHIYAAGLDWTKSVGVLVYADGSGDYGLANTSNTYLLAGTNGLIAIAKRQNMILAALRAPQSPWGSSQGCTDGDGVCWYLPSNDGTSTATKIKWADDFIQNQVLTKYNIDVTRVCIAGYSSGAQFTMEYYGPQYASAWMEDGLLLGISYGGSPKVTANYPAAFKQAVAAVWDVGSVDPSYTRTDSFGVQAGYDWYTSNGFATTELTVVSGEDHSRDGQFGAICEREIIQHVPAAT